MAQDPQQQSIEAKMVQNLFRTEIRPISNGWLLKTVSGMWYYKDIPDLLAGVEEYLKVMRKNYSKQSKEDFHGAAGA